MDISCITPEQTQIMLADLNLVTKISGPEYTNYVYQIINSTDSLGNKWLNVDANKFMTFVVGFIDHRKSNKMMESAEKEKDCLIDLLNILQGSYGTIKNLIFASSVMDDARYHYEQEIDTMVYKPKRGEGIYKCRKCKSTNIDTQALQLRSADEPVTVLARCDDCNFSWKDS